MTVLGDARELNGHILLREAAAQLEKHGWIRGVNTMSRKGVDLAAAIALAAGSPKRPLERKDFFDPINVVPQHTVAQVSAVWEVLELHLGMEPTEWNDQPERSRTEIINMFLDVSDRIEIAL